MKNGQNHPASSLPYRPCVGLMILNDEGRVFVGERIDSPGGWQMPQGGIEDGENIEHAAFREMEEEIGTAKANLLEILDHTLCYDLPEDLRSKLWGGQFRGQQQYWVAVQFTGNDGDIDLEAHEHPEFSRWQWVDLDEVPDLIVPFKRETYLHVTKAFRHIAKNLAVQKSSATKNSTTNCYL